MNTTKPRRLLDRPFTIAEDSAILAEIARGNLDRFDILVDRYKKRLMSYISHRVTDRHHAEDLAQEAFLRMFRAARLGGYNGKAAVSTWLFTITDNCVTDFLRASGRQRISFETDAATLFDRCVSPDLGPTDVAVHHESQARAETLLNALPEEQRRVVALKVLGELTSQEIAEVVGCPLGTVKSRLLRGLQKIETLLTACLEKTPLARSRERGRG
jgi:RNA polymerase sigma-70 factor (ECF subfamily)